MNRRETVTRLVRPSWEYPTHPTGAQFPVIVSFGCDATTNGGWSKR